MSERRTAGMSERRGARAVRDELRPMPWPLAMVLGVAGGLAAVAAFPPYDLWMLLPLSIAALVGAAMVRRVAVAAAASFAWGLAFFVPLTEWASTYAGLMPWLALGIVQALYPVLFGLCAWLVLVRRGLGFGSIVVLAALWTAVETLRSHFPWGGLPWGATGFALADSPLLNLGPWVGMAGLAFVSALLGLLVLQGVLALLGRTRTGAPGVAGLMSIAVAVAVVAGSVITPLPDNPQPEDRSTTRIAGIQGSMEPVDPATMVMPEGVFENHLEVTHQVIEESEAAGEPLDLIVWPEDSTGWDPRDDPGLATALTEASAAADAPIMIGTQTPTEDGRRYNHSLLWTQDGEVAYEYAKRHPVPFGEYIPWRDFFRMFTDKVDMVSADMIAGDEVGVTEVAGTDVGILICFEIAYDNLVRDVVDQGAELMVVQSNNALFGYSHEAIQQLAEAKVQAVINGRSVVHVSTVGHSAIFTPEGQMLDFEDHWEQGAVVADVPLHTGVTPAVAAGWWIAIGISAVGAAGLLAALGRRDRAIAPPLRSDHRGR